MATDLGDTGIELRRRFFGTYASFETSKLPLLPYSLDGNFSWLSEAKAHDRSIVGESALKIADALERLVRNCSTLNLRLPEAFTKFMALPDLHRRIRSNTDCELNLSLGPIESPTGGGHLVRFLADSQFCVLWYLYLSDNGADHAVVSSPHYFHHADEPGDSDAPPVDVDEIASAAASFEEFMCRFWLENEIWFAHYEKTPLFDHAKTYVERYQTQPT